MPRVRHIPQRLCVACRQMRQKRDLIRVVRTPAGEVRVDPTGKAAGRGAYVCPTGDCVEMAVRERRFEYALDAALPDEAASALRALAGGRVQAPGKA
jgi:predicted RNA-binding protein YlxR (DUF448 family)